MKFKEEEAYEKLVAQLTNNGKKPLQASERTLKHLLTRYYKKFADDETELDAFIADVADDFEEVNGNVNKDKADFVKQYQNEHKPKEEKPADGAHGANDQKDDDKSASVLEALQKQVAALIEERNNTKKANAIALKRQELLSKMEEKGIKDKEWANNFVNEISITEDLDVNAKADAYLKIYNKSQVLDKVPPTPTGGGNNKGVNPILDAVAKKIIKDRENKPKI